MRKQNLKFFIFFCILFMADHVCFSQSKQESLIKENEVVSDAASRLSLAKILAQDPKTASKALEFFIKEDTQNSLKDSDLKVYASLLMQKQQPQQALEILNRIQEKDDSTLLSIAKVHLWLGSIPNAKRILETLLVKNQTIEVVVPYIQTLLAAEEYLLVIRNAEKYMRLATSEKEKAPFLYPLAVAYEVQNQLEKSKSSLIELIRIGPHITEYKERLGKIYVWLNEYQNGFKTLQPIIKQSKKDFKTYYAYSLAAYYEGHREIAKEYLEKLTHLSKNDMEYVHVAELYSLLGNSVDSKRYCHKIKNFDYQLVISCGHIHEANGNFSEAESIYINYLKEHSDDKTILKEIADLYTHTDRFIEANHIKKNVPHIEATNNKKTSSLSKDEISNLEDKARSFFVNNEWQEAIHTYSEIIAKEPKHIRAAIDKAIAVSHSGDYEKAQKEFKEILRENPENDKALFALARTYSWNKNLYKSVHLYNQIIAKDSQNPRPYIEKARVLSWAQDFDNSQKTYQKLIEIEKASSENLNAHPILSESEKLHIAFITSEKESKKYLWLKKYTEATLRYKNNIGIQGDNQEALFDCAQAMCAIGDYSDEEMYYTELIETKKAHNSVKEAKENLLALKKPAAKIEASYYNEEGRGDLSGMTTYTEKAMITLSDNEYNTTSLSATSAQLNPHLQRRDAISNQLALSHSQVVNKKLMLSGLFGYKSYTDTKLGEFFILDTNASYRFDNDDTARISVKHNDTAQNIFALRQKLQVTQLEASYLRSLGHYIDVSGDLGTHLYDDNNSITYARLKSNTIITHIPTSLRFKTNWEFRNAEHMAKFQYKDANLINILNPYWTPNNYLLGSGEFSFFHDLNDQPYCRALQNNYEFSILGKVDTEGNPGMEFKLKRSYDILNTLKVGFEGLIHRSKLWDAEYAAATMEYRF